MGTNGTTTLVWRTHRLSTDTGDGLTRVLAHPGSRFESDEAVGPMTEDAAAEIELPELPDDPLDKAVTLLHVAAQVEHALMVQYLYAGYSIAPTQPDIVNVAVEEMSHLLTVQNLLRCIRRGPYLHRQDYGPPADEDERLFPFDFRLEPASHLSLAKYVVAESPSSLPPGVDPAVMARIVELATAAMTGPVNRVGVLYALLAAVFGSPQVLLEQAATGDPWFVAVHQLAVEAAEFYGGPEALHLPDSAFDSASADRQASDADWDRSRLRTIDEFRVHVVTSRLEALHALRDIGLQGEGPSPVPLETAHFRRFYDLFLRFFGPDGTGTAPPSGVLPVPVGDSIVLDPAGSGENVISHPTTLKWARLADLRYAVLLGALERYLLATDDDRDFLRGWCFAEMSALAKLAALLRSMPRRVKSVPEVAALPFTRPGWLPGSAQWADLAAAFENSMTITTDLVTQVATGSEQHRLLVLLTASDERKLRESTARSDGRSERTRTDAVRDVLDWAAGAGDPRHDGSSPPVSGTEQGRFWNLRHADLVRVEMFGTNITTVPGPDEDALLVGMLRSQAMPLNRPKLAEGSAEFRTVESWVADGCPDDPV